MSTPEHLLREARLEDAISSLAAILREDPTNTRNRTSLFELLCFAGDYDRAAKQLDLLASLNKNSMMGALNYHAVLNAERTRQQMFEEKSFPAVAGDEGEVRLNGTINGHSFESIIDADPRIGASLELFAAGDYLRIPFRDIACLEMETPKRLRDLLWSPVKVRTGRALEERELTDVLMPVLYPLSWAHPDDRVRLGRLTEWCEDETGKEAPYGQKMLIVSGREFPILELRTLQINSAVAHQ